MLGHDSGCFHFSDRWVFTLPSSAAALILYLLTLAFWLMPLRFLAGYILYKMGTLHPPLPLSGVLGALSAPLLSAPTNNSL